jgi:hypothetical protein
MRPAAPPLTRRRDGTVPEGASNPHARRSIDSHLSKTTKSGAARPYRKSADTISSMSEAVPTQPCKTCGHPFAKHTRDIHETGGMKTDYPSSSDRGFDFQSGREAGTSGCTDCPCQQWTSPNY